MSTMLPSTTAIGLRIHLLGGFGVTVGDCSVDPAAWSLRKAASLVKLLALAPGHCLHREQVRDVLWPDLDPAAAANNLHQVLHVARRALDPAATRRSPYLRREGELLLLRAPGSLWIDVTAFEAAAAAAQHSQAPGIWWAAIERYTGDLLPEDVYDDWAAGRRAALRQQHQGLLLAVARLHRERGEPEQAIAALQRLLVGEPAHEAAHRRLMRLYAALGQHDQAVRQYGQLKEALRHDLDAAPDAASQRLYEEIVAERARATTEPAQAAPPAVALAARLPRPLTSFVGRERELAEMQQMLRETWLLTLTGAGGVGKTRLAQVVVAAVQADYHDGVWLVELAALADPLLVPQAVARVLGVQEQPGRPLTETLAGWLALKHLLLVLDNCEHLLEACATLAETLLRSCPHLRILTTSREALSIAGETVWRVPSLAVPPLDRLPPLDQLGQVEAMRLLTDRARAAQPTFVLTEENAPAIAQVCVRLDGIPLALELAAARLRALPVEQLATRLDDCFRLLTGGSRTAPSRQQTLRATIDWSYDLLTDEEQAIFHRLAVFAGGWTLEAAEAVCTGEGIEAGEVLDLLLRLVDKSLVQVEAQGGEVRYRLLETVRQYAGERLREAGEEAAVRARHRAWYLALAEEAEPALHTHEQLIWLDRLEAEHDNLRAALAWCLEQDPAAGLRLGSCLCYFWSMQGYFTEGRGWMERLLGQAPERTARGAKALLVSGVLATHQGDWIGAHVRRMEALALSRELGDGPLIARATRELGYFLFFAGDVAQSRMLLQEAKRLYQALGDQHGLGVMLLLLSYLAEMEGDYRRARALGDESLVLLRTVGDRWDISYALVTLGRLALVQGEAERAEALTTEGLALAEELRAPWCIAQHQYHLGNVLRYQGDIERAQVLYEASLTLARELDLKPAVARSLLGTGLIAQQGGDLEGARARLEESLALFTTLKVKGGTRDTLQALGRLALSQGEPTLAASRLRESLTLHHEAGAQLGIAESLAALAMVAAGQDQPERAARLLGVAEALREAIGAPVPPVERPDYEETVRQVRSRLVEEAFAVARAAGKAMMLEQAVTEALSEEEAASPAALPAAQQAPRLPRRLERAGGGGAAPAGRRPQQPGDRRRVVAERAHRGAPHHQPLRQDRGARPG